MYKWGTCHFSPSNHHYFYNIDDLIKGTPLPSAIHVPASAPDATRIWKQDLSPPFTFYSFQPLDITLSSIPLACFTIWHAWFLPSQVLATILVSYFPNCCVNLNITEWVCSFSPKTVPSKNCNLRKCILNNLILRFKLIILKAPHPSLPHILFRVFLWLFNSNQKLLFIKTFL